MARFSRFQAPVRSPCINRAQIPWAIATSGSPEATSSSLEKLGLDSSQTMVLTGDDVEHGKPEPDLFLTAAERLGVPIERVYIVGDSVWDLLGARPARFVCTRIPPTFWTIWMSWRRIRNNGLIRRQASTSSGGRQQRTCAEGFGVLHGVPHFFVPKAWSSSLARPLTLVASWFPSLYTPREHPILYIIAALLERCYTPNFQTRTLDTAGPPSVSRTRSLQTDTTSLDFPSFREGSNATSDTDVAPAPARAFNVTSASDCDGAITRLRVRYGLRTTLMQPSSLSRKVLYMPGPSSSGTVWVITNDGSIWPS
jgi:Haloacid dehalogenase-like hydrolase